MYQVMLSVKLVQGLSRLAGNLGRIGQR